MIFKNIATWFRVRFGKQPLILDEQQKEQAISNLFHKEVEAAERGGRQQIGRYTQPQK